MNFMLNVHRIVPVLLLVSFSQGFVHPYAQRTCAHNLYLGVPKVICDGGNEASYSSRSRAAVTAGVVYSHMEGIPPPRSNRFLHDTSFLCKSRNCKDRGPFALLILNCNEQVSPASKSTTTEEPVLPPMLSLLYEISSFVMCGDGGANRLYDMSGGGGA